MAVRGRTKDGKVKFIVDDQGNVWQANKKGLADKIVSKVPDKKPEESPKENGKA
jgi:uncharacterized GH25 family protein